MSISAIKSTSGEASVKPIESRPSTSQSAERNLQDVFSAVLEQVGRSGYESSQPLNQEATSASSLEKEVGSSWEQWFNEFSQTRYSFIADAGSPSVRENKTAKKRRKKHNATRNNKNTFENREEKKRRKKKEKWNALQVMVCGLTFRCDDIGDEVGDAVAAT